MRQAGSIVKRGRLYSVVYRTEAGKQKWEGGFETKEKAQNRLTEVLGQIQTGMYIEPSSETLKVYAERWLKNRVNIEGYTLSGYTSYLKKHIAPAMGEMELGQIRHSNVQGFVYELAKKKLAPSSVDKIIKMLHAVFKSAVKSGLIRTNPADDLELPKKYKKPVQPPEKKDALAILKAAPPEHQTLFLLDITTGLRRGEVLALKWKNVDWVNGELIVDSAIKKTKSTDGVHKWGWKIGTTKGGRSRRVGLASIVIEALRMLRASVQGIGDEDFIFGRNGTFMDPEYFSKWIALPMIKKATGGRVKRFHDLRHFFASALIDNGENAKYVQDQVGHASISTTLDIYAHLWPQAKRQASKRLERSIFGKKASVSSLLAQPEKPEKPETVN